MKKITVIFLLISFLFFGCISSVNKSLNENTNKNTSKISILSKINKSLYPFDDCSYSNVSISISGEYIYVKAKSSMLKGEDIYLFVNRNGTLILKSYCLEALPESVRSEAIAVAMSNRTIAENTTGIVTVRRILPQTSAKFYEPKVLFSVTWHGSKTTSALVDLDSGKVVRIWRS
jgi:hypothetical protein